MTGPTTIRTTDATDVTTIEPLLEEVHAAEAAWRDGELPPLTATDRFALRAARRLLLRSRHHREHTDVLTHSDAERMTASNGRTFEHRMDAGPGR